MPIMRHRQHMGNRQSKSYPASDKMGYDKKSRGKKEDAGSCKSERKKQYSQGTYQRRSGYKTGRWKRMDKSNDRGWSDRLCADEEAWHRNGGNRKPRI